jgi:hypothetical protein
MVTHAVRDFEAWKPAFDAEQPTWRRFGANGHRLYRDPEDANDLVVAIEMPSIGAARHLVLEACDCFRLGGVVGDPEIALRDPIEAMDYTRRAPLHRWYVNADGC